MADRLPAPDPWPFPEPWRVEAREAAFDVRDGNGRTLVSVVFGGSVTGGGPGRMSRDQARRLANCIARLPWLLRR